MIRIAVCDDDKEALEKSSVLIKDWAENRGVEVELHQFENGDDLISKNAAYRMDIILLDIIMPMVNGIDIARELRQQDTAVQMVFLTSSTEFALEAYGVKARGYLLKPVDAEKLNDLLDDLSKSFFEEPKHLIIKTGVGYQNLYYRDIECMEAKNKTIIFYLRNGKEVKTTQTLYSFEDKLDIREGFFKCHRSYIVSIPNIDHYDASEIVTKSGYRVPIARGYRKAFQEAYLEYMFENR